MTIHSIPISNLSNRIASLPEELLQEPDLGGWWR